MAAELAANTRCENVVILDLRGRSPVTEFFIIATGTSPRQMRTVVDEVSDLGKQNDFTPWQQSGYEGAKWIVLDCVNVVIHVFDSDSRDFYDLELLWGDAPRIDWRQELGLPPEAELPRRPMDIEENDEEEVEEVESGDADLDEDAEVDGPVETEFPDESTGSNSVEFVEIDPPSKRGQKGRSVFPSQIPEPEDETAEEQAMSPMDKQEEALAEIEEEESEMPTKRTAKKRGKKKVAKKVSAKAKKPVRKVAKKISAVKKISTKVKKQVKKVLTKTRKKVVKKAVKKPVKVVKKKKK
jgi:ribosome-associated protein